MAKLRRASYAEVLKAALSWGANGSNDNEKVHNFKKKMLHSTFQTSQSDIFIDSMTKKIYTADKKDGKNESYTGIII
jgi:hypothetical protein